MAVCIARFADPIEAELARARLEAEGIACSLGGRFTAATLSGMAMSNLDLQVQADDEHEARRILSEIAAARARRRASEE